MSYYPKKEETDPLVDFCREVVEVLEWLGLFNKKATICLLGLKNAGKTTLLDTLKFKDGRHSRWNQQPNSDYISIGGTDYKSFDLGGAREIWKDSCAKVDAVVYMVDASDKERFEESRRELHALLKDESLAKVPFLILGNKVDKPCAASLDELREYMGVANLTTGKEKKKKKVDLFKSNVRPLEVFMCSNYTQDRWGYYKEGFNWLSHYIK